MKKPEPLKAEVGILRISEQSLLLLAKEYPSYVGKSVNLPSRWISYSKSAIWVGKGFGNSLDRINRRRCAVLIRAIDWNLSKDSLDVAERCAIARLRPTINTVTYNFNLDVCRQKVIRMPAPTQGIYQLIVIPKEILPSFHQVKKCKDLEAFYRSDLKTRASIERVYVPIRKLTMADYLKN